MSISELPKETTPRERTELFTFIKAWQKGKSAQAVADELGLKVNSVLARASKLRNGKLAEDGQTFIVKPIALKQMPRKSGGGGSRIDADAANKLLEELGVENVTDQVAKLEQAKVARLAKRTEKAAESAKSE